MIDWMIEAQISFKCDDQTFFLAASLLDRYLKNKSDTRDINDLHIIGVTSIFIASKYEDIRPLKMKVVFEKCAHKKLSIDAIKSQELDILKAINFDMNIPTVLDFLRYYLQEVLCIGYVGKTSLTAEKKKAFLKSTNTVAGFKILIFKIAIYVGKISIHDYEL